MCCAETGYLLGFTFYTGKKDSEDGSILGVVDTIVRKAGLQKYSGRVLYVDNYYTSISLAKHLYGEYSWFVTGTFRLHEKLGRTPEDPPFDKLSTTALASVPRGWMRSASRKFRTKSGLIFAVQFVTWKDRKQVTFLTTDHPRDPKEGGTTKRYVKGKRNRVEIPCPIQQKEYADNFHAVDRMDRNHADFTVSLKSNRWYLRLFFWMFDQVVFSMFIIVQACAKSGLRSEWEQYAKRNGRFNFQIDLALTLIEEGIKLDWEAPFDEEKKPKWMPKNYVPCECGECFFCKNNKTTGIQHRPFNSRYVTPRTTPPVCTLLPQQFGKNNNPTYCRKCMKRLYFHEANTMTVRDLRAREDCRKTTLGCPGCQTNICSSCYSTYDHTIKFNEWMKSNTVSP